MSIQPSQNVSCYVPPLPAKRGAKAIGIFGSKIKFEENPLKFLDKPIPAANTQRRDIPAKKFEAKAQAAGKPKAQKSSQQTHSPQTKVPATARTALKCNKAAKPVVGNRLTPIPAHNAVKQLKTHANKPRNLQPVNASLLTRTPSPLPSRPLTQKVKFPFLDQMPKTADHTPAHSPTLAASPGPLAARTPTPSPLLTSSAATANAKTPMPSPVEVRNISKNLIGNLRDKNDSEDSLDSFLLDSPMALKKPAAPNAPKEVAKKELQEKQAAGQKKREITLTDLQNSITTHCQTILKNVKDLRFCDEDPIIRRQTGYVVLKDLVQRILLNTEDSDWIMQMSGGKSSYPYLYRKNGERMIHLLDISQSKNINKGAFCVAQAVNDLVIGHELCLKTVRFDISEIKAKVVRKSLVNDYEMLIKLNSAGKQLGIQEKPFWLIRTKDPSGEQQVIGMLSKKYECNLEYLLVKTNVFKNSIEKRRACLQLLSGVDFLARNRICHGDIKPSNILFQKDILGNANYDICDFAGATAVDSPFDINSEVYTEGYSRYADLLAIRETYRHGKNRDGKEMRLKRDVFSAGVCILEILTGEYPLDNNNNLRLELLKSKSLNLKEHILLRLMLDSNPLTRIDAEEALEDAKKIWVRDGRIVA